MVIVVICICSFFIRMKIVQIFVPHSECYLNSFNGLLECARVCMHNMVGLAKFLVLVAILAEMGMGEF